MRQTIVAALLILSLWLTGCAAAGDENRMEAIRESLQDCSVSCEAEVTAFFGGEHETYTLSCVETADGPEVTVRLPELLSGVRAKVGPDGALCFDGLVLPLRGADGVSALSALPILIAALRAAHLDLVWREGDALTAQLLPEDNLAVRVWVSPEDAPAAAELILDGKTAVRCTVTKWNLTEKEVPHESDDPYLGGDQSQHPGT